MQWVEPIPAAIGEGGATALDKPPFTLTFTPVVSVE